METREEISWIFNNKYSLTIKNIYHFEREPEIDFLMFFFSIDVRVA